MAVRLSHRERVMRSIEHGDIDRIPLFFRAEEEIRKRIKEKYNLKTDMEVAVLYDTDAVHLEPVLQTRPEGRPDENGIFQDIFGNIRQVREYKGSKTSIVLKPALEQAEQVEDIFAAAWPNRSILDLNKSMEELEQVRGTGLAVYGGIWASIFTRARDIMGEEHFLVSTALNPGLIDALVARLTDFYLDANEAYFSACAKYIDVFYFGSDFGTQSSMFISRDMFIRFFKPNMKRLVKQAKEYGLKVMFHTCGAVCEIIPDLIECGIDILDPVQVSAANMNPENLAAKFKGKITFHGGISSQTTLPFGAPEEVRTETIRAIDTFGPTGYIAASDQDMTPDTPLENIDTMFRTIREYKV